MSTTPNMSLIVPEPLVTTGPTYATQINSTLDVIDAHDHSAGKGVRVTPSGLNINADLSFNQNSATNLKAVVLAPQASVSTNAALYNIGGDLFYRRGDGTQVQITTVAGVNTSGVGGITGLGGTSASASYTNASSLFAWLSAAATFAKQATGDLLIYSRAGAVGVVQAVTLVADVATSAYSLYLPATGPTDNQIMRMTAASASKFVTLQGTANQVTVTHNTSDTTLSLPQNIHTAATPTFAGLTLTGALGGTTANLSGQVNVGSLVSAGAVSGTTGTFSAAVSGTTGTFTGAVSGTTGTFTGAVSGTSGTFSGNISLTGGASSTISGSNYDATFNTLNAKVIGQALSPSSNQLGYTQRFTAGLNIGLTSSLSYDDNIVTASLAAGIWEVDAQLIIEVYAAGGNNTVQLQTARVGVSTNISAWDDDSYNGAAAYPNSTYISSGIYMAVKSAPRTLVLTSITTIYVRANLQKATTNTQAQILGGSYLRAKRIG